MSNFHLDWAAGAGAQIEVFNPGAESAYQLKYTPPFRRTIRPPLQQLQLGPGQLDGLSTQLDEVVNSAGGGRGTAKVVQSAEDAVENQLRTTGGQLFDFIIPSDVSLDLHSAGLFLEFGVEEDLVQYPWELMHDGEDYIALKHFLGRYVNSSSGKMVPINTPKFVSSEKLKILLVCSSNPQPRIAGVPIERLTWAETEAERLVELLSDLSGVELRVLKNNNPADPATFDNVYNALKQGCHIFHYTGHAYFDEKFRHRSSLVLWDKDMSAGPVSNFMQKKPPVLCFVNGCETALNPGWVKNYNIFSLAQAFLSTGAYLLGSRWKLEDIKAAEFAVDFYTALLQEEKSVGEATTLARKKLKDRSSANSFAWASYVLYADPRVCFKQT
ncbi:MAG: hypothetical protein NTAFB09_22120 [Nitrosospira sp.]